MGITVKDAMRVGQLTECRVIAGDEGLNRTIEYITVMEVPDVIRWLKGNELLITSLFPIKDDLDAQESLVPALVQVGAAGLAIKTHRFVDEIPDTIIKAADNLGLPVIEIGENISYVDIITPLMRVIFQENTTVQPSVDDFFKWITEMAMEGKDLDAMLQVVEDFLQNDITLESEIPLVSQIDDGYEIEPLSVDEKQSLIQSKHSLRLERKRDGKDFSTLVTPVLIYGELQGILTCWQTHHSFEQNDLVVLERVVPLIALEFLKAKTRLDVESKYKNDLLMDILLGNLENEAQILTKAKLFGWDLNQTFRVVVCNVDGFNHLIHHFRHEEVRVQEYRQVLFRSFERIVAPLCPGSILGMRSDELIVLYPARSHGSHPELTNIKGVMKSVLARFNQVNPGVTFTAGISRPCTGVLHLFRAYDEAQKAIRLGRPSWGRGMQVGYEDLGVYLLFDPLRSEQDVVKFYNETIGPVDRYDTSHDGHLVETLARYFHQNYSLTDTANTLFVHVNTLKYRLQKVEDISGYSLGQAEGRLRLQIGMKIRSYLYGDVDLS